MSQHRLSSVDRLIAERAALVHVVKGKDHTGRRAVYYVAVERTREKAFLAALHEEESFELGDWGTVIASNYGDGPSEASRRTLRERYGFAV